MGYTEDQARAAIAGSKSWTEALRRLGYCPSGGNPSTLKKYAAIWRISTDHFDPYRGVMERIRKPGLSLEEILVEHSTYSRSNLKRRLFEAGLKEPRCEMCGQGEIWRGRHMSMILDHVNGVRNDNRLETCGWSVQTARRLSTPIAAEPSTAPPLRNCARCGEMFRAKHRTQRFCSRYCGMRRERGPARSDRGVPCPDLRNVERPPYEKLLEEIEATSYLAVGRKYGVSDNAVRKWVRFYERQMGREAAEATAADVAA